MDEQQSETLLDEASGDAVIEFRELGAVILSAGASSRMGRPKLLLPWKDTTVLGHLLAVWKQVGAAEIAVVCAANDQAIGAELDRLSFPVGQRIINPESAHGMFSSIQCAARWTGWRSRLTHWAVALGDQPHLRRATLRRLLQFAAEHPPNICQPSHGGHPRHPVLFPKRSFRQLGDVKQGTLRQFLEARTSEICLVEIDDPGLDLDLDFLADYERALRLSEDDDRG